MRLLEILENKILLVVLEYIEFEYREKSYHFAAVGCLSLKRFKCKDLKKNTFETCLSDTKN